MIVGRQLACTVCTKAFFNFRDMERHESLHSLEEVFVCNGDLKAGGQWGCGRRFAGSDDLGRHFRSGAGSICIKPLLDEEIGEAKSRWENQCEQQTGAAVEQADQLLTQGPTDSCLAKSVSLIPNVGMPNSNQLQSQSPPEIPQIPHAAATTRISSSAGDIGLRRVRLHNAGLVDESDCHHLKFPRGQTQTSLQPAALPTICITGPSSPTPSNISSQEDSLAHSASLHAVSKGKYCQELNFDEWQYRTLEDFPFTDSGYESGLQPELNFNAPENFRDVEQKDFASSFSATCRSEAEARTTYSAATTVVPNIAQRCILEVCQDIYNKAGRHVSDENWGFVSNAIPDLIKAFAIKLGSGPENGQNRRMMYFVHKHHQYVLLFIFNTCA